MIEIIVNKVLIMILILSILNAVRHCFYAIQAWYNSNEETPQRYSLSNKGLIMLGLSIAYILTSIFTGVNI